MNFVLHDKLNSTVWTTHSSFQWGETAGSSVSTDFYHNDFTYTSASGPCFGTVSEEGFTAISPDGTPVSGKEPSKEWPLHPALYERSEDAGAVIHTHSTYPVLWTLIPDLSEHGYTPGHTPYLKMKLGTIGLVPYERPGFGALFIVFRGRVHENQGYLLGNHGPVIPGKTIMDVFYCLEGLEKNARVAWELYRAGLHHP